MQIEMAVCKQDILPAKKDLFFVGGSVRDILSGREPADYDIVCCSDAEETARRIAAKTNGSLVKLGKPGQILFRIISDKNIFDLSPMNGSSIETDLQQRDFTINAMACSVSTNTIIDCTGGMQDLKSKQIRMVSEKAFQKDPLRLLRAYRFSAALNFKIEPSTAKAIKKNAKLILKSAGERVWVEILKLMDASATYQHLVDMAASGLLFVIFPELDTLRGCEQNQHHIYDVFEHTMNAFYHLERLLNNTESLNVLTSAHNNLFADKKKLSLLKLAILLHDIGKPSSRTIDKKGNYHFYGHAAVGADMSKKICKRLKMSSHETCFIDFIIRYHLRPLSIYTLHLEKQLTTKAVTRFFKTCHNYTPYILLHAIADSYGKSDKPDKDFKKFSLDLINDYFTDFKPLKLEPPLITGNDLIKELGLKPSPLFGKILNHVEDARLSKEISNKNSALKLAKEFIKNRTK